MLSFECIKNEKSVYFLLTSAAGCYLDDVLGSIRGVVGVARLLPKHSPGRPPRSRFWHIQDSKPRRSPTKSTSPNEKEPIRALFRK